MTRRLESRLAAGSFASGVGFLVGAALTILQVPVLLSYWSPGEYGLWLIVLSTYALIVTLDSGYQDFVAQRITLAGVENAASVRRILGSSVRAALLIGMAELSIAGLVAWSPIADLGPLSLLAPEAGRRASLALVALTAQYFVFGSVGGILARLYASHGMYPTAAWFGAIQKVLCFVAVLWSVARGGSILEAAVAQVAAASIVGIAVYLDFGRRFPHLWPWWQAGSLREGLQDLAASLSSTLAALSEQFGSSGLLAMSGRIPGGTATSSLATLRTVGNAAIQASAVILQPAVPELGKYASRREPRKIEALIAVASLLSTTPIALALTVFGPAIPGLYRAWTAGAVRMDERLLALVVVATLVRQWLAPIVLCLTGSNLVVRLGAVSVTRTVASLGIALLALSLDGGVVAIGAALLVGEVAAAALGIILASASLADLDVRLPAQVLFLAALQVAVAALGFALGVTGVQPWLFAVPACLVLHGVIAAFQVHAVPDQVLERLRSRLALLRWPGRR